MGFWSIWDWKACGCFFFSEENRPVRPVIESPVNETMEVILGKWPPIRIHWNHYFELKIKINCTFVTHYVSSFLNISIIRETVVKNGSSMLLCISCFLWQKSNPVWFAHPCFPLTTRENTSRRPTSIGLGIRNVIYLTHDDFLMTRAKLLGRRVRLQAKIIFILERYISKLVNIFYFKKKSYRHPDLCYTIQ